MKYLRMIGTGAAIILIIVVIVLIINIKRNNDVVNINNKYEEFTISDNSNESVTSTEVATNEEEASSSLNETSESIEEFSDVKHVEFSEELAISILSVDYNNLTIYTISAEDDGPICVFKSEDKYYVAHFDDNSEIRFVEEVSEQDARSIQ